MGNKLTFFLGITTYGRLPYLKQLINSFNEFSSEEHNYIICINDDGSTDGTVEYLQSLKDTKNKLYVILYSNRRGSNFASNSIFHASLSFTYDLGFKLDDDLVFTKKGWEKLYYDASQSTGYYHLSHYSTNWASGNINRKTIGKVSSITTLKDSQGAFYTFNRSVIEDVGFIDTLNFGRRGEGHRDWSMRACRQGYNVSHHLFDALGAEDYIKLHSKQGYLLTPHYQEELNLSIKTIDYKRNLIKDSDRYYIESQYSPLNHMFDGIFCINLKRREDRKLNMQMLFESLSLDVTFIEAFDGRNDDDVLNKFRNKKQSQYKMTAEMFGCHLSHLYVYKKCKELGLHRPLILEDDLLNHININRMYNSILRVNKDWGILYLGASDYNILKNGQPLYGAYYMGKGIDGTFAYSVKDHLLDDLINAFEEAIVKPCDTLLHDFQAKYKTCVMYPNLFIADVRDSDIRITTDVALRNKQVGWDPNSY